MGISSIAAGGFNKGVSLSVPAGTASARGELELGFAGRACQMACMPGDMHARASEHRYVCADMASMLCKVRACGCGSMHGGHEALHIQ